MFRKFFNPSCYFQNKKILWYYWVSRKCFAQLKFLCPFSEEKYIENMQHLWSFYWHWFYWKWRGIWHFLFALFMWDSFLLFGQPFWIYAWSICGEWNLTIPIFIWVELIYLKKQHFSTNQWSFMVSLEVVICLFLSIFLVKKILKLNIFRFCVSQDNWSFQGFLLDLTTSFAPGPYQGAHSNL